MLLVYSEDIDIKDLEKYFLASSQGQAPGFSPKNFITIKTFRCSFFNEQLEGLYLIISRTFFCIHGQNKH